MQSVACCCPRHYFFRIDILPRDILLNIFRLLPVKDILNVALVKKEWYWITNTPEFNALFEVRLRKMYLSEYHPFVAMFANSRREFPNFIFRDCEFIKSIKVEPFCEKLGPQLKELKIKDTEREFICNYYYNLLLRKSCNLETLRLVCRSRLDMNFLNYLPKLKKLSLEIHKDLVTIFVSEEPYLDVTAMTRVHRNIKALTYKLTSYKFSIPPTLMANMIWAFPELEKLHLEFCSHGAFAYLRQSDVGRQLKTLKIRKSSNFSNGDIKHLAQMANLEELKIYNTVRANEDFFRNCFIFEKLTKLAFGGPVHATDEALHWLAVGCKSITHLSLKEVPKTSQYGVMQLMQEMPKMVYLSMRDDIMKCIIMEINSFEYVTPSGREIKLVYDCRPFNWVVKHECRTPI